MPAELAGMNETDVIAQLPESVVKAISALEKQKVAWDQIGELLAASPTFGIALKGGGHWSGALWPAVKSELHSFLCTDSVVYADLRGEWDGLRKKSSVLAVGSLSGVIGSQLGVASGVVAPLVVWAVVVGLRIGKQALCSAFSPESSGAGAEPPKQPIT